MAYLAIITKYFSYILLVYKFIPYSILDDQSYFISNSTTDRTIDYKIGYDYSSQINNNYSFHGGGDDGGVSSSSFFFIESPSFFIIILITSYSGSTTPVRTA